MYVPWRHHILIFQRVDKAIHWINCCSVDSAVHFVNTCPLAICPLNSTICPWTTGARLERKPLITLTVMAVSTNIIVNCRFVFTRDLLFRTVSQFIWFPWFTVFFFFFFLLIITAFCQFRQPWLEFCLTKMTKVALHIILALKWQKGKKLLESFFYLKDIINNKVFQANGI